MLDLGRTFLQSVERRPDRLALVDGDVRLTYAQWHARIRSACALRWPSSRGDTYEEAVRRTASVSRGSPERCRMS